MQITGISAIQTTKYNNNKNSKQPSFGSLTQMFEKTVYNIPYQRAEYIVSQYTKPNLFVGYFPSDILGILKKTASSGKVLKQNIQTFNKELSKMATGIRASEDKVFTQIDNINLDDYTYRALAQAAKNGKRNYIGWVPDKIDFFSTAEDMEKQLRTSGFEETMKKIGLIPEDGKVDFTFAGKGTYKKCFKLDFLDKDGNPVIHPKAFVIAQNPDLGWDCNRYLIKRIGKYLENQGLDGFTKTMERKMQLDSIGNDEKEKMREMIEHFYNGHYKTSRVYNGASLMAEYNNINGIFPEANTALKIRKDLGKDIGTSNIITPYIFDLKSKYGLLEFADKDLESYRKIYDFDGHGLEWLDGKLDNFGDETSRIIDFGSIVRKEFADYYRW